LTPAVLSLCLDTYPQLDLTARYAEIESLGRALSAQLAVSTGAALSVRQKLKRYAAFIYQINEFRHAPVQPGTDTFLLTTLLDTRVGSCLGLTLLYLVLAEQVGVPMYGVLARQHIFARYDDGAQGINLETSRAGIDTIDSFYAASAPNPGVTTSSWPYLTNLTTGQLLAVLLSTRAAHLFAPQGRHGEALADLDLALQWFPYLPDAHLNRGILLAMQGELVPAVESFTTALQADPQLAGALRCRAEAWRRLARLPEAAADERRLAQLEDQNPRDR
jgi:regulator of sirC expression with transglutaminase-like and TPR domain